jgi:hypothetical protein
VTTKAFIPDKIQLTPLSLRLMLLLSLLRYSLLFVLRNFLAFISDSYYVKAKRAGAWDRSCHLGGAYVAGILFGIGASFPSCKFTESKPMVFFYEGFRSIENKNFPTKTNKNSQDLIYEMQNNERERLDLHTLVDRTAETFR